MLCFRTKTKVRYAILLCLISTLCLYGGLQLTGCCHGLLYMASNVEANSDLVRRSYTAKWHDSRELLNEISDTQKMSNIRAKFVQHLADKSAAKQGDKHEYTQRKVVKNPWVKRKRLSEFHQQNLSNREVAAEAEMKADERDLANNVDNEQDELAKEANVTAKVDNNLTPEQDIKRKVKISAGEAGSDKRKNQDQSLKDQGVQDEAAEGDISKADDNKPNRKELEHAPPPAKGRDDAENHNRENERDAKHNHEQYKSQEIVEQNAGDEAPVEEHKNTKPDLKNFRNIKDMRKPKNKLVLSSVSGYGKLQRSNHTVFDPNDSVITYHVLADSVSFRRSLINKSRIDDAKKYSPMTPEEALNRYGHRLPPWEQYEIFNYPKIYYIGAKANKTQLTTNETVNFGLDYFRHDDEEDDETAYNVVVGDHIGYRYEILKFLGAGSFGSVVLARDWSNPESRNVALKIFHHDEDLKYILREMKMNQYIEANATNLDYYPHMLATFIFRTHYCMVMELLGHSIDRHFVGAVRNMTTYRRYAQDILNGLKYLKELNIVHADLKPDNIMFMHGKTNTSEGQLLKVADFGIGCMPGSKVFKCPAYYMQTRYYRAPEVMLSLDITPRVDMFSVGVIFAELFLGVPPFFGESEYDQFAAMMEVLGVPPTYMIAKSPRKKVYSRAICYVTDNGFHRKPYRKPLTKVLRDMEPALFDLVARCLEFDPKLRLTPEEALEHPFLTGKYPADGFPKPMSIKRLEGIV